MNRRGGSLKSDGALRMGCKIAKSGPDACAAADRKQSNSRNPPSTTIQKLGVRTCVR